MSEYPLHLYMGGTFNPIHFGHLHGAIQALEQTAAERLYLLPNYLPPHKSHPNESASERRKLCELSLTVDSRLYLDERELKQQKPCYTIDTLKKLRQEFPDHALAFVIGMDSLQQLNSWRGWSSLLDYGHLLVLQRGGYQADYPAAVAAMIQAHQVASADCLKQTKQGSIAIIESAMLQISSSDIRARYRAGLNSSCLLPAAVDQYIIEHQLYLNNLEKTGVANFCK